MNALEKIQADLDEIADEVDDLEMHVDDGAHNLADRLRNLLTDRNLDVAPWASEIIAWLEADPDHVVKYWNGGVARWLLLGSTKAGVKVWRTRLAEFGDQRQHGYRLGVREPATERVRLDQVIGHDIAYGGGNGRVTVRDIGWHPASRTWRWYDRDRYDVDADAASGWLKTAPDGTVEVLKDDSK